MPIKIDCQNCGFQNDLGRVFCVQCGKRLELTKTSLDELADRRTIDWLPVFRKALGLLVFLAIVGVIALAFWPQPPSSRQIDPAGVQQLPMKMRVIQNALRARQPIKMPLGEAELNGFLAARAQARSVRQLTVDLKPGGLTLAAWYDWAPATQVAGLTGLSIRVSCEWSAGFDQGTLSVKGGRLGHLPLPAPAAAYAASQFHGWFDDVLAQTGLLRSLKSVTIDDAKAVLEFGP